MADQQKSPTSVSTGVVRLSYAHLWEAVAIDDDSDKKFSTAVLIKKDDKFTLDKLKSAIEFLKEEAKKKFGGKLPKNFKLPLRDGDEEKPEDENYAGHYFLNASSKRKPGIVKRVGEGLENITKEDEVYSGCYVRLGLNLYIFDVSGNRGIAVGLNNVLKVKDGEPLAGGSRPEDDFSDDFEYEEAGEEEDSFLT
jgi:Protein of unknown function (DUF2815)